GLADAPPPGGAAEALAFPETGARPAPHEPRYASSDADAPEGRVPDDGEAHDRSLVDGGHGPGQREVLGRRADVGAQEARSRQVNDETEESAGLLLHRRGPDHRRGPERWRAKQSRGGIGYAWSI